MLRNNNELMTRGRIMMRNMLSDRNRGLFPLRKEKKMRSRNGSTGIAALILIGILITIFVLMAVWTDRSLDFWLTYAKGEPTNCPWYLSAAATFLAPIAFLGNIGTEIFRLCVDENPQETTATTRESN